MSGNYEKGVAHIQGADIDLLNDDIGVILIDGTQYTPDLNNDETLADVPEDAYLAEKLLTSKTLDGTTFRADNTVFSNVPAGPDVTSFIIFKDTGDFNTSYLIYFSDNSPELPITPDGTDITIQWDAGPNGIFKF